MVYFSHRYRFYWLAPLIACAICWLPTSFATGESSRRSAPNHQSVNPQASGLRLYAEPNPVGASPFLPEVRRKTRYPLALRGFSAIDLRDQRQWVVGKEEHQAIFDGQLYRFSDARQRAIFAAAPQRYAPVLGVDCIVTYTKTGDRVAGDVHFGLLYGQRLFFFAGAEQREQFRADPTRFVDADLAHQGNCIVSKVDRQQLIKGLPKTVTTVGGLRYFFAGAQQQAHFLANLQHYGAKIGMASAGEDRPSKADIAPPNVLVPGSRPLAGELPADGSGRRKEKVTSDANRLPADTKAALAGYCPVSIRDNGTWEEGDPRLRAMYDGKVYQFAGESEKALFIKNPAPYVPALAGDCVVSLRQNNKLIPGSIYYTAGYEGRLFLFAGAAERLAFKAAPIAYANVDLAMDGNCAVTYAEKGETVAGLPEYMTWNQGKRYYFLSQELKEKFLENPQSYTNPLHAEEEPLSDAKETARAAQ